MKNAVLVLSLVLNLALMLMWYRNSKAHRVQIQEAREIFWLAIHDRHRTKYEEFINDDEAAMRFDMEILETYRRRLRFDPVLSEREKYYWQLAKLAPSMEMIRNTSDDSDAKHRYEPGTPN